MDLSDKHSLQKKMKSRLLLFPLPLQGHITPMLQLGGILHSKGFSITIIQTKLNAVIPDKYPNFSFHTISNGLSETQSSEPTILDLISDLNSNYVVPFERALTELTSDTPVSCLISDAFLYFTRTVAERFNVPRFVLRTSGISSFRAFASFSYLVQKGYLPVRDSILEEPIEGFWPLRVKDLPVVVGAGSFEFLTELINQMVQETKASAGIIWNSYEELEQPALDKMRELFSVPIYPLGPFHKYMPSFSSSLLSQDKDCIPWLETKARKSVIYASFGSLVQVNAKEMVEIGWGLANSMHPFLLVVRPGLMPGGSEWAGPDLMERIDGRGLIVQWAPQLEVLAHSSVGAFLSHCGWNSTVESVSEGVPMICMPRMTDQLVNARYVSHDWRVGVSLDGLDRGKVEQAVRILMEEKVGEGIRERIDKLKEKAALCLKPGGSSYESLNSLVASISSP